MEATAYKLCFFVPLTHLERVKDAVFAAGGGRLGAYDRCCWQTEGQGQFRPLEGSDPCLGQRGEVYAEPEMKVEMICTQACLAEVLTALKQAHPYETPAFETWPVSI